MTYPGKSFFKILVVYYFNIGDGSRHIAGTILEIE
jgi:hypothetical protein